MKYPEATDYHQIIQNPRVAFHDGELQACTVETNGLGTPIVYSGGFALTYFLKDSNKKSWVVRCFKNDLADRERRYEAISNFLNNNPNAIFINATYQKRGIQVAGKWYPIVKMPKVAGETLHKYIERRISLNQDISDLHQKFLGIVETLRRLGIAHGDLQHGNIMVSGDQLILVDYDGMYLPALNGLPSSESGHESYQHPGRRSATIFNAELDNFSSIVIYLALRAVSLEPRLWQRYSNGDNLLFKSSDFHSAHTSSLLNDLEKITAMTRMISNFRRVCEAPLEQVPTLEDFLTGGLPSGTLPYIPGYAKPPSSQHSVLDAADADTVISQIGNRVTIVGCIAESYEGRTRTGGRYLFLNFGDYKKGYVTLVLWPETLKLFEQQNINPISYTGCWVSVTGLITSYNSRDNRLRPQIIIELPSQIEILDGEDEAKDRLGGGSFGKLPKLTEEEISRIYDNWKFPPTNKTQGQGIATKQITSTKPVQAAGKVNNKWWKRFTFGSVVALMIFFILRTIITGDASLPPTATPSITTTEPGGVPPSPDVATQPPTPQMIAYAFGEVGDSDILAMSMNTEERFIVADFPCDEAEPNWSPDGRRIVFQSNCNGSYDIVEVLLGGHEQTWLISSEDYDELEPSYSPNGKTIVFQRVQRGTHRDLDGEIWSLDITTGHTYTLGLQGRGPVWAPDGVRLAYMSKRSGSWNVYLHNFISGSEQLVSVGCSSHCRWPEWSPEGNALLYSTTISRSDFDPAAIWIWSVSQGAPTKWLSGIVGRPSWSAAGLIAFNSDAGLELSQLDGSGRQVIIRNSLAWSPAWSQ